MVQINHMRRWLSFGGLMAAFLLAMPMAYAGDQQIDKAKAAGIVGERIDGYLGIVSGGDASIQRKVAEINARRRAVYADLARETGESQEAVARLTGEKQIQRAKPGEYYMDASGRWKQR